MTLRGTAKSEASKKYLEVSGSSDKEWGTLRISVADREALGLVSGPISMRLTGNRGSSLFDTAPPQETGSGTGKKYNTRLL